MGLFSDGFSSAGVTNASSQDCFPKMQKKKGDRGFFFDIRLLWIYPGFKYIPASLTALHIFHAPNSTILASQSIKHHHKTHRLFSQLQQRHAALQSPAQLALPLTHATWIQHKALKLISSPPSLPPSHTHMPPSTWHEHPTSRGTKAQDILLECRVPASHLSIP